MAFMTVVNKYCSSVTQQVSSYRWTNLRSWTNAEQFFFILFVYCCCHRQLLRCYYNSYVVNFHSNLVMFSGRRCCRNVVRRRRMQLSRCLCLTVCPKARTSVLVVTSCMLIAGAGSCLLSVALKLKPVFHAVLSFMSSKNHSSDSEKVCFEWRPCL